MSVKILQSLHYIMNPPSDKYGSRRGVHPKMVVSFPLPLENYTGKGSPLRWTTPNPGCTFPWENLFHQPVQMC